MYKEKNSVDKKNKCKNIYIGLYRKVRK